MSRKIVATQALKKQTLEVNELGIAYAESAAFGFGETLRYTFEQIDAVVQNAETPVLSIQIGSVVHHIAFRKSDETHRAVIAEIVAGAQRALPRA